MQLLLSLWWAISCTSFGVSERSLWAKDNHLGCFSFRLRWLYCFLDSTFGKTDVPNLIIALD